MPESMKIDSYGVDLLDESSCQFNNKQKPEEKAK